MTERINYRQELRKKELVSRRFQAALLHGGTGSVSLLTAHLFAAAIVTLNQCSQNERDEILEHLDNVRVLMR